MGSRHLGRYFVCKRDGQWSLFDPTGVWVDVFDSLEHAHTWATQSAVCDAVFEPGGLERLSFMLQRQQ